MRLADPRLTLHQQHPAHAGRRRRHQLGHHLQLGDPPDRRHRGLLTDAVLGHPQMPAIRKPLQAAAAPIHEPHRRHVADQLTDHIGHQHLTTIGPPGDTRRRVDSPTERIGVDLEHLTGVDPEPHPWTRPGQRTLRRQRERHRLAGRRKRHQKPVTGRLHQTPAIGLDPFPHHIELTGDRRQPRPVTDPGQQLRSSPPHRRTPPSSRPHQTKAPPHPRVRAARPGLDRQLPDPTPPSPGRGRALPDPLTTGCSDTRNVGSSPTSGRGTTPSSMNAE